ncbi:NAD(P)H-dependent oxidoreductase [Methanoplanus endosymbiosus]|uniref:NAD(P)H-dependent oxidoreductase n=1 Tax=Methanoplanus endosymbiosus TaxID=33865 RepID=A0A9E7PP67_9EURY|nr:NAD(P)H-dependent oxidoreductase [Methanoplanus endosymbiosus]
MSDITINVLGISGSPRKNGNTEKLLDCFLKGAYDAGGAVEKIELRKLGYKSCMGCNKCHKSGVCVVHDDLTGLYMKILSADITALASPIYSMSVTAEIKGLIDRGQYLWARKFILEDLHFDENHVKNHKGFFISTAGMERTDVFDYVKPVVTAFFNDCGIEFTDTIAANGMDKSGGIEGRPEIMKSAYNAGREAVLSLAGRDD